jgi:nucleotide-binding universal stress UspA family protein
MKIKPSKKSGSVVVELNPRDSERLSRDAVLTNGAPPRFKLAKILVPIDFSDCSKKALQYAIPFAKQFGATITLLHVVHVNYIGGPEVGALDFPLIEADLRKSAEKQLAELAATEVQPQAAGGTLVRIGQEVVEIVGAAKELESDLIIISTHGRTGLKHVFMGSVAENVVRLAHCPVLVVREHEHEFVKL